MSREKKKDCLHYAIIEGKKIIQRMFILHTDRERRRI